MDVDAYLRRRYEIQIANIEILTKEDLDLVSYPVLIACKKLGFSTYDLKPLKSIKVQMKMEKPAVTNFLQSL